MASGSCLRWSLDGGVQGGLVGRAVFCFYPLLGLLPSVWRLLSPPDQIRYQYYWLCVFCVFVPGYYGFVFTKLASYHHQTVIIMTVERLPIQLSPHQISPFRRCFMTRPSWSRRHMLFAYNCCRFLRLLHDERRQRRCEACVRLFITAEPSLRHSTA